MAELVIRQHPFEQGPAVTRRRRDRGHPFDRDGRTTITPLREFPARRDRTLDWRVSGWTGVDLSQYDPDQVIQAKHTNANQSALESFTVADPTRRWTVREIAEFVGLGGRGPLVAGSPEQVADLLQQWMDETGVDGFNLAYAVLPENFENIIGLLVPELQRRGGYKREYRPGTLRDKLFGNGARLPHTHPARRKREAIASSF